MVIKRPISAANDTAPVTSGEDLGSLVASWRRHLVAGRMSPRTIDVYATAVRQLSAFLRAEGMPTAPASISREHIETFITDLLARWKPATPTTDTAAASRSSAGSSKRARFRQARWPG